MLVSAGQYIAPLPPRAIKRNYHLIFVTAASTRHSLLRHLYRANANATRGISSQRMWRHSVTTAARRDMLQA